MSKRTGKPCRAQPLLGSPVCRHHGGKAPQTQRAAARRLAEAKAAKSLADHGVEAIGDPAAALLEVAEHAVASYKWLATYAAEVQGGAADTGELLARVQAMGRQQERAARVLAEIQRLGLAERRVEITAQQVALMQQLVERLAIGWGLDPRDREVSAVAAREIRGLREFVIDGEVVG